MEFYTKPKYFRKDNVAVAAKAAMKVSTGNPELAITATQFTLGVNLSTNGSSMNFLLVENMLRSFLAGNSWEQLQIDAYIQEESRFIVRFAPPNLVNLNQKNRRELQEIEIDLDFAYMSKEYEENDEKIFSELLIIADYALRGAMLSLGSLAPAVFDKKRCFKLCQILPLMRPLKSGLKLDKRSPLLEKLAEKHILYATAKVMKKPPIRPLPSANSQLYYLRFQRCTRTFYPLNDDRSDREPTATAAVGSTTADDASHSVLSTTPWTAPGECFGHTEFVYRRFVVLTEDGDDIHEPFYLQHSLKI